MYTLQTLFLRQLLVLFSLVVFRRVCKHFAIMSNGVRAFCRNAAAATAAITDQRRITRGLSGSLSQDSRRVATNHVACIIYGAYPAYRSLRSSFFALYRAYSALAILRADPADHAGTSAHVSGMVCGIKKKGGSRIDQYPAAVGTRRDTFWNEGLAWLKRDPNAMQSLPYLSLFCFLSFFRIVYVNAIVHTSAIYLESRFFYVRVYSKVCVYGIHRRLRVCARAHAHS